MKDIKTDPLNTILVISKGRPDNYTGNYLKDIGYQYWAVVIEDDEEFKFEYYANFGENHVLEFNLRKYQDFDTYDIYGTSLPTGASPVRNACINMAKELGLERFWNADDDISCFQVFKNTHVKKKVFNGEELYDYLNCYSKLAKTINAESVSPSNDSFIVRDKTFLGKQMFSGSHFLNLPANTKFKFENRGYDDVVHFFNIHRHGGIVLLFRNILVSLKDPPKDLKKNSGAGNLRKTYTKDIMCTALLLANPHSRLTLIPRKHSKHGQRLNNMLKIRKIRSQILNSKYG